MTIKKKEDYWPASAWSFRAHFCYFLSGIFQQFKERGRRLVMTECHRFLYVGSPRGGLWLPTHRLFFTSYPDTGLQKLECKSILVSMRGCD